MGATQKGPPDAQVTPRADSRMLGEKGVPAPPHLDGQAARHHVAPTGGPKKTLNVQCPFLAQKRLETGPTVQNHPEFPPCAGFRLSQCGVKRIKNAVGNIMADYLLQLATFENLGNLLMLCFLQAVLGFDNLLYISIESQRAPVAQQAPMLRRWGILIAVALRDCICCSP